MYRLLIVEDDDVIAGALMRHLQKWGYEALRATDYADIAGEAEKAAPQLVLMDIVLPFYNGFHWCAQLRKSSDVPIIFISSASDNLNIVMAMSMGGDDFIAKPFDLDVLTAKIQALLRRTYERGTAGTQSGNLCCRGASLSTSDSTLSYNGEQVELTKNEYRILYTLLENRGRIVSRDTMMLRLWETDSYVDDNTLTVNVNRLRKKLDALGLDSFITTRKGEGYIIQ